MTGGQLGNRIREWRTAKGLSLAQLASLIDSDRRLLSKVELGQTQLTQQWMVRVARALDIFPSDLLPEDQVRHQLNRDEDELLRGYRAMTAAQRQQLSGIAAVIAGAAQAA